MHTHVNWSPNSIACTHISPVMYRCPLPAVEYLWAKESETKLDDPGMSSISGYPSGNLCRDSSPVGPSASGGRVMKVSSTVTEEIAYWLRGYFLCCSLMLLLLQKGYSVRMVLLEENTGKWGSNPAICCYWSRRRRRRTLFIPYRDIYFPHSVVFTHITHTGEDIHASTQRIYTCRHSTTCR